MATDQRFPVIEARDSRSESLVEAPTSRPDHAPGLIYRFKLKTADGALLGQDRVRADTDEEAIGLAMRRLVRAAIVEVWRQARWVGQVQRATAVN